MHHTICTAYTTKQGRLHACTLLSEARHSCSIVRFSQSLFLIGSTQIVLLTLSHQMLGQTAVLSFYPHLQRSPNSASTALIKVCILHWRWGKREMAHFFPTMQTWKKCFIFTLWQVRGVVRFTTPPCLFTSWVFPALSSAATIKMKGKIMIAIRENHSQMLTMEEIVSGNTGKPLIYFGEK